MNRRSRGTGRHHRALLAWSGVVVAGAVILLGLGSASLAASTGSDDPEPARVWTNDDLPDAYRTLATQEGAAAPAPVTEGFLLPRHPEFARTAGAAFELRTVGSRRTVPELMAEYENLQRRRMRLVVPFFSRRFAATPAEEREVERVLDARARLALLLARLDEIHARLSEAGVGVPPSKFGQPAPLIVPDLGEGSVSEEDVAEGPAFDWEDVARPRGADQFRARVFGRLEEFTAFVTVTGAAV